VEQWSVKDNLKLMTDLLMTDYSMQAAILAKTVVAVPSTISTHKQHGGTK
jgi:hypothetical protein